MNTAEDREQAAIEAVVEAYFQGMYRGEADRLRGIFHEQAWLFGERRGEARSFPAADFFAYVEGAPVPEKEGEAYDMAIEQIDRTGTVAMVKVRDLYQGGHFTDYLMLAKGEDGWRIVAKGFFSPD